MAKCEQTRAPVLATFSLILQSNKAQKKPNQWKNNLKENTTSVAAFDKRPAAATAAAGDLAARCTCRLRTDILIFHPKLKRWSRFSSALFFTINQLSSPKVMQHI